MVGFGEVWEEQESVRREMGEDLPPPWVLLAFTACGTTDGTRACTLTRRRQMSWTIDHLYAYLVRASVRENALVNAVSEK